MKKFIVLACFIFASLFVLVGCTDSATETKVASIVLSEEVTKIAIKEDYCISYTIADGTEKSVSFSSSDETIATVDESGYVTGKKAGEVVITIKVVLTTNLEITKEVPFTIYDNKDYVITLNLAGGTCATKSGKAKAGETFKLPTPTKEDADFLGWTVSGVEGYVTEIKVTGNVTVYAKWLNYYKITYNLDGGTYAKESEKVADGTSIVLENPVKAGNKFLGWSLSKNGTTYIKSIASVNSNCIVYAIWEPSRINITFDCDGGTYNGNKYVTYGGTLNLGLAQKFGYTFLGWSESAGSTTYITKLENVTEGKTLYANFEAGNTNADFIVSNLPEKGIECLESLTLAIDYSSEAIKSGKLSFASSDEKIFTVDTNGVINTFSEGVANLTVSLKGTETITQEMEVVVYVPGYFDARYETTSYVEVGKKINLYAAFYNEEKVKQEITFRSLTEDLASVSATGEVTGIKSGSAIIRAELKNNNTEFFDFIVTVVDSNLSAVLKFVLASHESNVCVRYNLGIGAGIPAYYMDIIGSVSDISYTTELEYHRDFEAAQAAVSSNHAGVKTSTEFVCVHYTGNMGIGANARANANYFANGGSGTSIHYTTGNDGAYHVLDDSLIGFHAGDGHTEDDFYWRASGVKVQADDPTAPVWGISSNGKYTINGRETNQSVVQGADGKEWTKNLTSDYYTYNGRKVKAINDMGLAYKIVDGEYYMGTTWWCYDQVGSGKICNKGGNMNSIGIESCVDKGSDLWTTWHITAELVAELMRDNNLDITRVVGHHFFSGKNCPQPMLENDMELWYKFIELVTAEYEIKTTYKDYTFNFEIISGQNTQSERAVQSPKTKTITYKVTVSNGKTTETITLSSIMNGAYTKEIYR